MYFYTLLLGGRYHDSWQDFHEIFSTYELINKFYVEHVIILETLLEIFLGGYFHPSLLIYHEGF